MQQGKTGKTGKAGSGTEHGNVLFLILIAVALFAALSYAVTQSTRSGSGSAETEKLVLQASEILNYATAMSTVVMRLQLAGCTAADNDGNLISFERAPFDGSDPYFVNPNAPADFSCHVFHPNGGGLYYLYPDKDWLDDSYAAEISYGDLWFPAESHVLGVGTDTVPGNRGNKELLLIIPYVSDGLCKAITKRAGIYYENAATNDVVLDNASSYRFAYPFQGSYSFQSGGINEHPSNGGNVLEGVFTGCFRAHLFLPANSNHFYHVLIAR
jgi:hypothetical protein